MPAPIPPQLDLFEHSQDTMLRNDVLDALWRRDATAAGLALQSLRALEPLHPALPDLVKLLAALQRADQTTPFHQPATAMPTIEELDHQVVPAALAQWGPAEAVPWLAPLWRALASRAAALPFHPAQPAAHAAPLWLRAGDGPAAEAAVRGIEAWQRIPAPLAWMAEARCRSQGLDSAWPLLAELAWLAAPRLAALADAIADPLLTRLLRRFDAQFDPGDAGDAVGSPALAWWPAWLLIDQPALLPHLRGAQPGQDSPPERSFRLLVGLLGLERQGRHAELMAGRRRLRGQQPALYAAYMRSR